MKPNLDLIESRKMLKDANTSIITLMAILLITYGDAVFNTNATILFRDIERDFNVDMPEEVECKINAGITAMTTDLYYKAPYTFKAVTLALSDGDMGDLLDGEDEELEALSMLWTRYEVNLLRGDAEEEEFDPSVEKVFEQTLKNEAVDNEDIEDSVDTYEEAMRDPFYVDYIKERVKDLGIQLMAIGCSKSAIAELFQGYNISADWS